MKKYLGKVKIKNLQAPRGRNTRADGKARLPLAPISDPFLVVIGGLELHLTDLESLC